MKQSAYIYILLLLFGLIGCKGGGSSAQDAFGVKLAPDVNINLMAVAPSNKTLFVGESIQFSASGGTGPYVFSLDSGIGIVSVNGFYTAPTVAGSAVVKATDSTGEEAFATIRVAVQVSISPTSAVINEGDTLTLSGSGGIPPYSFAIVAGDGAINNSTGIYDASGVTSGSAVIRVLDNAGNSAFSAITINPSLVMTPAIQTIGFGEQIAFSATGGDFPYTYSILTGNGSVNSSTGLFTGPSAIGSTVVRVTDSSGNSVDSVVTIVDSPQIDRPQEEVARNRNVTFTATNGSPPYIFSIVSGGGSINATTGVFTAANDVDTTVVQVTDVNGYTDSTSIDTFIPIQVTAGEYHTCALIFTDSTSSTAKCWGWTSDGNYNNFVDPNFFIGDDPSELGDTMQTNNLGTNVLAKAVKVGRYMTCVVTTDNRIKCFGDANYGSLMRGNATDYGFAASHIGDNLPYIDLGAGRTVNSVLPIDDVIDVESRTVCVIMDNNKTKCWGYGAVGKLGNGLNTHRGDHPTEIGDNIIELDYNGDEAIQISVGPNHVCAVLMSGEAKCWGNGGRGRLGQGNTSHQQQIPRNVPAIDLGTGHTAKKVSAGSEFTCVILNDDRVKCWGRNNRGQLGYGDTIDRGDGPGEMGDNLPYVDLGSGKTALDIETQFESVCALLNDNTVKCWGYNGYGNLGIGSTTQIGDAASEMGDALLPVNLGAGRTATKLSRSNYGMCAFLDNADVKCWGRNNRAQMAAGHLYDIGESALSMGDNLSPINISSSQNIISIQTKEFHGCAVLSNNTLKCWGGSFSGSRGSGDSLIGDEPSDMGSNLPSLDLGANPNFKEIKSNAFATCGLDFTDRLACWGYAGEGSLALGNSTNRGHLPSHWGDNLQYIDFGTGLTVKQFSIHYRGGCALLSNDTVACWGRNNNGQLGHGNKTVRGDNPTEIGDNFILTDLGNTSIPVDVSKGYNNACARFTNGQVKCWGYGAMGQNGKNNNAQLGDGGGEMGNSLTYIDLGTGLNSAQLCSGLNYNCSRMTDGRVKCWGEAANGQLGTGDTNDRGNNGAEMGDNLPFVDLGTGRTAQKISCGYYHVCALLDNDQMKCWGEAGNGQLGTGDTNDRGNNAGEMGDLLPYVDVGTDRFVLDIATGRQHSCAVLDNNTLKCWGRNNYGQLGQGHTTDLGTLGITMGDSLPEVDLE